jgi:hypothetical protein
MWIALVSNVEDHVFVVLIAIPYLIIKSKHVVQLLIVQDVSNLARPGYSVRLVWYFIVVFRQHKSALGKN